ncbi:MAG: SGNH/GDSL hydrolase family protein [Myxococcota bacterium]
MSSDALGKMVVALALALVGCGAPLPGEEDGGDVDAGVSVDAGPDAGEVDAGDEDAGLPDAGADDAGSPDAGAVDAGRQVLVYPVGPLHSPLTPEVAAHLRAVAARGPGLADDVFAKVGDSNTVNTNYLSCFAGTNVDLAGRTALQPALDAFRGGTAGATTPFNRVSLAATVGWSAGAALAGSPSPLEREVAAISPRFATVMFGTNDVGFQDPYAFGRNLFTIADTLLAQGVVPIFTSVPRRDDSAAAGVWVPRYNLVTRGVAQARRVPFVDLYEALETVPAHGLGGDGVHLNVYAPSGARGCVLTPAGLGYGHNTRNLLTLEALARARGAVLGEAAPDATAPLRGGDGTLASPIVIDGLPFVDVRDTRVDGERRVASYPGCASAANESGPEVLYRLELAQPATVRAFVVSLSGVDVDVHLLSAPGDGQACLARNDKVVVRALAAGTSWLALDTYVSGGVELAGEYLLAVLVDP